jgi:hypothetical protein
MTASLNPALALDFITALSADIRAAVVFDAAGAHLAGPPDLATAACVLLRQHESAGELEGSGALGKVFVARDDRHVIVVVTGPLALARVTRHDLRTALSTLGGQKQPIGPPGPLGDPLVSALLSAV